MSFVIAAPELLESAAHDLAGIGSSLGEATGFAAAHTTSIAAAGADEVSTAIAALFGGHGQEFQALTAQAAAFHEEFVGLMKSGGVRI
jgi:PE family